MKRGVFLVLILLLVGCATEEVVEKDVENEVVSMKLVSNDFNEGEDIPKEFTCQGDDFSPHLAWDDVPEGVKSFALICDDPDAPSGTWVHWLVKDIPADVKGVPQRGVPGVQVVNDFGKEDYGGPCPPSGKHRYFFRLYALDVESI
ncbi:MAG: YbhB/YbcL family Raf kinase inhibitor-like protein, partial [Nanoarchaeota archaeon]|nr:YbhB/YbcL family Raf kinase inhibitor-like protein [Nanoarchaeota archaeon]